MSVAQDVSFQLQSQPLDRLLRAVRDVDVDEDVRSADPDLPMEPRRDFDRLQPPVSMPHVFVERRQRAREGHECLLGCSHFSNQE